MTQETPSHVNFFYDDSYPYATCKITDVDLFWAILTLSYIEDAVCETGAGRIPSPTNETIRAYHPIRKAIADLITEALIPLDIPAIQRLTLKNQKIYASFAGTYDAIEQLPITGIAWSTAYIDKGEDYRGGDLSIHFVLAQGEIDNG